MPTSGIAILRAFGDDADAAVRADADPAAHHDAVHERDDTAWGSGRCTR